MSDGSATTSVTYTIQVSTINLPNLRGYADRVEREFCLGMNGYVEYTVTALSGYSQYYHIDFKIQDAKDTMDYIRSKIIADISSKPELRGHVSVARGLKEWTDENGSHCELVNRYEPLGWVRGLFKQR